MDAKITLCLMNPLSRKQNSMQLITMSGYPGLPNIY